MLRFLLIALLLWFLYNLVFRLIVPVAVTTKRMKKKFREMHEQMRQDEANQGFPQNPSPDKKAQSKPDKNDYIEFEEVK